MEEEVPRPPSSGRRDPLGARHPQFGHPVEHVAGDEDLVLLGRLAARSEPAAKDPFEAEDPVLRPGLRVLPGIDSPPSAPDLGDRFDVGVAFGENGIARDDGIPPRRHHDSGAARRRRGVDLVCVVGAVGGQLSYPNP